MAESWNSPEKELILEPNAVHIWKANLEGSPKQVHEFRQLLSQDEQARAQRFHFDQHTRRFILGRGILRTLLGRYLKIEPESVQFCYSDRGKPSLISSLNPQNLQFNVSHSEDWAVYGFTLDRLIGIDIEHLRSFPQAEDLAQRFFSLRESEALKALSPQAREKAFFQLWTGKEAYLKAMGTGLAGSLDQVELAVGSSLPHFLSLPGEQESVDDWLLKSFTPTTGYLSTVVVLSQQELEWQFWQFD